MTSVPVVVPMVIRRRGGRKGILGPDGAPVQASAVRSAAATRGDAALGRALGRAFRLRRMLDDGGYAWSGSWPRRKASTAWTSPAVWT